jgi:diadenosine tetraphosphate (Ap4A) HIT family hydrolase
VKRAAWSDPAAWRSLCDGTACPICVRGSPLDVVAQGRATWITAGREAPLPGYACVVSKRHVVEPFELPAGERAAFWEEAMAAAQVVADLYRPVKMNYEVHGNVIPHLHLHLYPRTRDDPYGTGALAPHDAVFTRSDAELERLGAALRAALGTR